MTLITISAGDVQEYHGTRTPATARLFANEQFTTNDGVVIAKGSKFVKRSFYQEFTASLVGTAIRLSSGDAYATTNSNNPNVTYTLVIYDTNGREITTIYTDLQIPSDTTPTTWQALEIYSAASILALNSGYYTRDEVDAIFGTLTSAALKASDVIFGVTELDTVPAVLATPIAVGKNSTRLTKNLSNDYGNDFATAISAIGVTPAVLDITESVITTSNVTVPSNITLRFSGTFGLVNIGVGFSFTVGSMEDPGNRQVFSLGDATSVLAFSAGAVEKMNTIWLTGFVFTNIYYALNLYLQSASTNGGGVIYIPEGTWTTAGNHVVVNNLTIEGAGKHTTTVNASANSNGIFTLGANIYNVLVKDITLDGNGYTTAAFLCSAAYGASSSGKLRFENTSLQGATYGYRLYDTASTQWQMATISWDSKCDIRNNTYGIWCNSTNNVGQCDAFFEVGDNQWAGYWLGAGQWTFTGEHAGSAYTGTHQIETQTISGGDAVTVSGIAQSVVNFTGLPGTPVTVYVNVNSTIHTSASLIAAAFRTALGNDPAVNSFCHVGGTGADIQLIPLEPGVYAAANFTINTGTATGITNHATSTHTASGTARTAQQARGHYFTGSHGNISFIGAADEGFSEFIVSATDDLDSPITFMGWTLQGNVTLTGAISLSTVNCRINNKAIRDNVSSGTQYTSNGDKVPSTLYLSGAFRTLDIRRPHNFSGSLTSGSGSVAFNIDTSNNVVSSQYPIRSYKNENFIFQDVTRGQIEALSYISDNAPALLVGRCNAMGIPDYYYAVYRDVNGILCFVGNQVDPYKGYNFNSNVVVQGDITLSDLAYDATSWNGSLKAPTRNAVRDHFEALFSGVTQVRFGTAVLVAGVKAVTDTAITANSIIIVNRNTDGGTIGCSYSITRSVGASFTITSKDSAGATQTADTSTIGYVIIEH